MKKIAICTAIAAICAAPITAMAGADLYGQLRVSLNSVDSDGASVAQEGLTVTNNTSLFGFKASSEGDGIKAFVHMQTGADADTGGGAAFSSRFYFGGLSGDFGKVAYGRMTNAYKFAGFAMDPFYNHMSVVIAPGAGSATQVSGGGATFGLSGASNGFTNNALQYTSNKIGDIKINVGLYIDDTDADEHGMGFGAEYNKSGVKAGIQFASNGTTVTLPGIVADGDAMRLYGSYTSGPMTVAASYETVDLSATTDTDYIFLVGKYKMSDKTRLAATLGMVGDQNAQEGTGITVGVFQAVAPKTELFASTSMVSSDATGQVEPSVISVGVNHKF